MRKKLAAAAHCGVLIVSLAGCADRDPGIGYTSFANGHYRYAPLFGFMGATTPPLNTILLGPCNEEFGMPDPRRANCELYYRARGTTAPWQQRQAALQAATYAPGELRCWRTLGGIAECETPGPLRTPPALVSPNNLKSE
jgi:hypothetical protein